MHSPRPLGLHRADVSVLGVCVVRTQRLYLLCQLSPVGFCDLCAMRQRLVVATDNQWIFKSPAKSFVFNKAGLWPATEDFV